METISDCLKAGMSGIAHLRWWWVPDTVPLALFFTATSCQKTFTEMDASILFPGTVMGARADEETIERLIETGDGEQIFQKAIQEQGGG
ncbi:hypothetical protein FF1_024097 [Malus domestica]